MPAQDFLYRLQMQPAGLFATLAILLLGVGLSKYDNNTRTATAAWRYIDLGAQVASLVLASQLLHKGGALGGAVALMLMLLAIAVAYGHYSNTKNSSPSWNYVDGADMALWGSVVLSQLGVVVPRRS